MSRINVLDSRTSNAIKAGEVIERPVSVVKELVDNSIDAGADNITIEFEGGGISLIRVIDNGIGMDAEDAEKCFLIHATSKIKSVEDLYNLSTQGFRGEALASIAACSEVSVTSKQADMETGIRISYKDGVQVSKEEVAADRGTVVLVEKLFANIPARYKFLKRDATESMYICSLVEKLAIINPHISIKLFKDGKKILSTPGTGSMEDVLYSIYGKELVSAMIPVSYELNGLKVTGFTGKPSYTRGNRGLQYVYVNGRPIVSRSVTASVDEAYKTSVMKHKYPVCFLSILMPSDLVDVNVHPQKAEVKFSDESAVFRLVLHGIRNALFGEESGFVLPENVTPSEPLHVSLASSNAAGKTHSLKSGSSFVPAVTASSSESADNLLKILSKFKPDVKEISRDSSAEAYDEASEISSDDISSYEIDNEIMELKNAVFTGFLFSTYIIMQTEDKIFLVDQHAAHERVLYERFGKRREKEESFEDRPVQALLIPQIIDVSAADMSFIGDNRDEFRKLGFDIDPAGDRQIALRSVPLATKAEDRLKSMSDPVILFKQILEDLKKDVPDKSDVWVSLIQTTACKAAIKAHDVINRQEAEALIQQLCECKDPGHCAHGRPTFIAIPEADLQKKFKRIL